MAFTGLTTDRIIFTGTIVRGALEVRTGAHVSFHVFRNVHEPSPEEALFMEELQYAFWQMEDQLW
jgi:hypothetical protein